jgi:hypothetical protein
MRGADGDAELVREIKVGYIKVVWSFRIAWRGINGGVFKK